VQGGLAQGGEKDVQGDHLLVPRGECKEIILVVRGEVLRNNVHG